jgi:hypothetical protein
MQAGIDKEDLNKSELQELKMKGKWKVLTDPAAGHCRGI